MRSLWTGAISFGLVNIPVKLYSGSESHSLDLDMLHSKDLSPIRFARVCRDDGKEVPLRLEKPRRGQTRKVIKKTQDKRPGSGGDEPAPGSSDGGKQGAAGGELGGNPYKRPGGN